MSPPLWLPGVTRIPSTNNGGSLTGGPAHFIWHSYEAPYALEVGQACQSLIRAGNEVHFVFHPHGGLAQILPANIAGRGLKNAAGGVQTNRIGTVALQVEVIAYSVRPWTLDLTAQGAADLARLHAFAQAWGVPDVWPAGPPPAFVDNPPRNIPESPRSPTVWLRSGHFAHSQVPENDHGDPGAVSTAVLLANAPPSPPARKDDMDVFQHADGRVFVSAAGHARRIGSTTPQVVAPATTPTAAAIADATATQAWVAEWRAIGGVVHPASGAFLLRLGSPAEPLQLADIANAVATRLGDIASPAEVLAAVTTALTTWSAGGPTAAAFVDALMARVKELLP